LVVVRAIGD